MFSFSEAVLQKAKLSSFGAVFKVFDMVHLKFRYLSHVYVHLQAVIEKRKRVSQKVLSKM